MVHILPSNLLSTCTDGTLSCIAQWAFDVTKGTFWVFMLLGFCVALYMATARLGNVRAFGFSSFTGMIGAMWFAVMGLMSWWLASMFIIVGVVGIAVMVLSEK